MNKATKGVEGTWRECGSGKVQIGISDVAKRQITAPLGSPQWEKLV